MGLLRGVFDDGHALRQRGGQHNVHGGAHGDHVHVNLGAHQLVPFGPGLDVAAADVHLGPHGHKALDVLVDGPPAEVAAARRGHLGAAETSQKRTDEIIGGADFPRQLVGHFSVADMGAVHVHRGPVHRAHVGAQLLQDGQNQGHIADLGNIFNTADAVHQKRGRDNSHRRVFCSADFNFTVKRLPTADHILCQSGTLYSFRRSRTALRGIQGGALRLPPDMFVLNHAAPTGGHGRLTVQAGALHTVLL